MATEESSKSIQEFIEALLSPQREQELDPFFVITFLPIESHHRVADIGCGPGFFTIPLAKHLIDGKVYALDLEDEMLEVVRLRVAQVNLGNVEIMKCGATDFPIPESSLDGVLLAFVIHQNEDHVAFIKAVKELLKNRGWCGVLEWYKRESDFGPPVERRIDPEELGKLAREAGFEFQGWRDLNGKQYMAVLRR